MSVKSMTGHGRASLRAKGVRIEVSVSSLNRRQLDVAVKLPRMLAAWEPRVEELVADYVSRGRVAGTVDIELSGVWRKRGARVDTELAEGYVEELRQTARRLGLRDDLGATALLSLPEVVCYEEGRGIGEKLWNMVEKCLRQAMQKLVRSREREGQYLRQDLQQRLRNVEAGVKQIRERAPEVSVRYREQLLERLRQAGLSNQEADDRLLREVALFADRVDITEEITRLESHISQFRIWLKGGEAVGRTLDFAVQEMFREVNTIGSKANDVAISHLVVMLKTELERIREQVQNIE